VASNPPADLVLTPLKGKGYPLSAWLVQYHLLLVVLDPFTNESAWILPTATRVLETFAEADCRVAFVLAGATAEEAEQYLGPLTARILIFPDPDRAVVKSFGLERLPAIIHVANDGTVVNASEDWDPDAWQLVTDELARVMSWLGPVLPVPGDPSPYRGSPALG
jgi:hypothetical protein